MKRKVLLISIDGMRPDGLRACGHPFVHELEASSTYTYEGSSVTPSVTLPCHYSMTHSVTPQRHGILSNTYVPEVRPVMGLFEKVQQAGMSCAMLYGWEPLRDIARPGAMRFSHYEHSYAEDSVDTLLTDEALRLIDTHHPDLVFLYMVDTDEKGGHDNGWMSEEYLRRIYIAIDNVRRAVEHCGDEYAIVLMADHGGHDRSHGTTCPEDMTVPFFFRAPEFEAGRVVEGLSLLDIAPTVVRLLGLEPDAEWEGHPVV